MPKNGEASTGFVGKESNSKESISKDLLGYGYNRKSLKDGLLVDRHGKPIQIPKQEPEIRLFLGGEIMEAKEKDWIVIDSVNLPSDVKNRIKSDVSLWINNYPKAYKEQHKKLVVRDIEKSDVRPHESNLTGQGLFGTLKHGDLAGFLNGSCISTKLAEETKAAHDVYTAGLDVEGIEVVLLGMTKKCNTRLTEELERDDHFNNLGQGMILLNLPSEKQKNVKLDFLWAKRDIFDEQLCYEYGPLHVVQKFHPKEYQDRYHARMQKKNPQAQEDTASSSAIPLRCSVREEPSVPTTEREPAQQVPGGSPSRHRFKDVLRDARNKVKDRLDRLKSR